MRLTNRSLWRTEANVAVPDHNIPTKDRDKGIIWCMAEIYAMKLAIQALQGQIKDIDTKLGDSHKD